ncbi:sensor histidine kinase [Amycolatopsis panacis]|uniref:histidine kinase n=1 Tax=Amycolatopsis panacis TaxID=2340917 RepID=A0A419I8U7_9PSEU|nr:histidine kinase [Amycolatopsis panacis]RJQ88817.1 two-component sensor histidine kinase [Amycolatopsis panacis]
MSEPPPPSFSARATDFVNRVGASVVLLLAALVFDLVYVTAAALDHVGPRFVDFGLFPGIFAMAGCALWARKRAAFAGMTGALALVAFTMVIHYYRVPTYSSVLANLSITEVVAGVEMVYFTARRVRPGVAFCVIGTLVVATTVAVFGRFPRYTYSSAGFTESLVFGFLLLVAAVLTGLIGRPQHATDPQREARARRLHRINDLALSQWPLLIALGLGLFLEFAQAYNVGLRSFPILFCSILAAVAAIYSRREPARASLVVAGLILLAGVVMPFLRLGYGYEPGTGIPPAQVAAGLGVVVNLVRVTALPKAWPRIAALSVAVAVSTLLNFERPGFRLLTDPQTIGLAAVLASLLLGIAIAIGLFLRSRDSEQKQVVKAAVSDAQTAERMALARELHDVVAHHVTGIVVQAQAARMMGEKNPQLAYEAMARIEDAGVEALAAMRRLVRSMRGDAQAGSGEFNEQATTDLAADLRRLVESGNHSVPTSLRLDLPPHLPQEVGRSALRLVQESLTNIGKHAADATEALVHAEVAEDELHLRVMDDGREPARRPAGGSGGYGLVGMRERVALLHGRLSAGRGPDGGWRVEAWLPLEPNGETNG